jgi:biopolymer transport protein ExbD
MRTAPSVLGQTAMQSVLAGHSTLHPKGSNWKRNLSADLLLTALIDAFSILVIFLLMSFSSSGEIIFISKDAELPAAALANELERNLVVRVEEGKVYVENKLIAFGELTKELLSFRNASLSEGGVQAEAGVAGEPKETLIVQGDRRLKYEVLSQVIAAASQAGYSDIRFAVVRK